MTLKPKNQRGLPYAHRGQGEFYPSVAFLLPQKIPSKINLPKTPNNLITLINISFSQNSDTKKATETAKNALMCLYNSGKIPYLKLLSIYVLLLGEKN